MPGAVAMSVHQTPLWLWILISAQNEATARQLADDYELGEPVVRPGPDGASWLRAMSAELDKDLGEVRIELVGPHRPPPTTEPGT